MTCPQLTSDGICEIISTLAYPFIYRPTPEDCKACKRCNKPQSINEVTRSLADVVLLRNGYPSLNPFKGPGTRLAYTISWFKRSPPNCNCGDRAAIMDAWDVNRCIENKSIILAWLRESALDADIPYSEYVISKSLDLLFISCKLLPVVST